MSNQSYHFAQVSGPSVQWRLKRNCSVTPVQLGWMYLSLCTVSLGIGVFFWMQGATLVLAFAGLEVAVVGLAFLAYARHAADGEMISLQGQQTWWSSWKQLAAWSGLNFRANGCGLSPSLETKA